MKNKKIENEWRLERKFRVLDVDKREVELLIKNHPLLFSEIYKGRYINNIYLDTHHKKSYHQNIIGLLDRYKIRIRWYGPLFGEINNPILECKIKKNEFGRKVSFPLAPFKFEKNFTKKQLKKVFAESKLPEEIREALKHLEPSLVNRYHRRYFQSFDRDHRITVDTEMEYTGIRALWNSFLRRVHEHNVIIVEVKYKKGRGGEQITNFFPFRMTKNSKYIVGVESLLS